MNQIEKAIVTTIENDLIYMKKGYFTSFISETKAGENIISEMVEQNGSSTIQTKFLSYTLRKIRLAGYKVCKAQPNGTTLAEIFNSDLFKRL